MRRTTQRLKKIACISIFITWLPWTGINGDFASRPFSTLGAPLQQSTRDRLLFKGIEPVLSIDREAESLLRKLVKEREIIQKGLPQDTATLTHLLSELSDKFAAFRNEYLSLFLEEINRWEERKLIDKELQEDFQKVKDLIQEESFEATEISAFFPPYAPHEAPQLAVIVPLYETATDPEQLDAKKRMLRDNILSFLNLRYPQEKRELILIDNGSPNQQFARDVQKEFPWIRLIRVEKNLGYAGGLNVGIRKASAGTDAFLLLNNDTYHVDPDALTKACRVSELPEIGLVGLPQITEKGVGKWKKVNDTATELPVPQSGLEMTETYQEVVAVTGFAMFVRQSVLERIGLMNPDFFLYYEETSWNATAREKGLKNVLVRTTRMVHVKPGMGTRNPHSVFWYSRNKVFYAKRHHATLWLRYGWPVVTFLQYLGRLHQTHKKDMRSWTLVMFRALKGFAYGWGGRWKPLPPQENSVQVEEIFAERPALKDTGLPREDPLKPKEGREISVYFAA